MDFDYLNEYQEKKVFLIFDDDSIYRGASNETIIQHNFQDSMINQVCRCLSLKPCFFKIFEPLIFIFLSFSNLHLYLLKSNSLCLGEDYVKHIAYVLEQLFFKFQVNKAITIVFKSLSLTQFQLSYNHVESTFLCIFFVVFTFIVSGYFQKFIMISYSLTNLN